MVLFLAIAHLGFVSLFPRQIKSPWRQVLSHPGRSFACVALSSLALMLALLGCYLLLSHVALFNYSLLLLFNCSLLFSIVTLLLSHGALLHSSILDSPLISCFAQLWLFSLLLAFLFCVCLVLPPCPLL